MEEGPEGLQKPNIKYSASLPMLCELLLLVGDKSACSASGGGSGTITVCGGLINVR